MLKKDSNSNLHKRMYKGAIAKETDPSQRPLCNQVQDRVLHRSRTKPGTFVAPEPVTSIRTSLSQLPPQKSV